VILSRKCGESCQIKPYELTVRMLNTEMWLRWVSVSVCSAHRPTLIDMSQVYRQTNQENLEQAFSVAERELGVTRLLDPEGELFGEIYSEAPLT